MLDKFIDRNAQDLLDELTLAAAISSDCSIDKENERLLAGYIRGCYDKDESFKALVHQLLEYTWNAAESIA